MYSREPQELIGIIDIDTVLLSISDIDIDTTTQTAGPIAVMHFLLPAIATVLKVGSPVRGCCSGVTLRVAFPPVAKMPFWQRTQAGLLDGFVVDVLEAVALDMGLELLTVDLPTNLFAATVGGDHGRYAAAQMLAEQPRSFDALPTELHNPVAFPVNPASNGGFLLSPPFYHGETAGLVRVRPTELSERVFRFLDPLGAWLWLAFFGSVMLTAALLVVCDLIWPADREMLSNPRKRRTARQLRCTRPDPSRA